MEPVVYRPIGVIRTPFPTARDMPIQVRGASGVIGRVELLPELEPGLADLAGFSHLILVYHFHRAREARLRVVPFLDTEERGIFATRSPARPNPIGLSVVRLRTVVGCVLEVENVDVLDGTPLLDLKPYVPAFDRFEAESTGWIASDGSGALRARSDGRFSEL